MAKDKSESKKSKSKRAKLEKRIKQKNLVSPKYREQMIAEAAYFKALNRNFQGDYCVEDWLQAETEIDTHIEEK